jgi:hypothetical protein
VILVSTRANPSVDGGKSLEPSSADSDSIPTGQADNNASDPKGRIRQKAEQALVVCLARLEQLEQRVELTTALGTPHNHHRIGSSLSEEVDDDDSTH